MPLRIDYGDLIFLGFALAIGILALVRGLQIRWATVPVFVVSYRGWSSPALAMPYGAVYMFTLAIGTFRDDLPTWLFEVVGFVMMLSLLILFLGFFVWFPWFLLPGWYRRARKAGVPRHDPYAMARFKRLSRTEQRGAVWADLFDGLEGEVCVGVRESLSVPRSPVGGAAVGLVVGLGVGSSIPVEVGGKSLGNRMADGREWLYGQGKNFLKSVFG